MARQEPVKLQLSFRWSIWHRLLPDGFVDAPATTPHRVVKPRDPTRASNRDRCWPEGREVIDDFDQLVAEYDETVPFQRSGQYVRHRATIDRRPERHRASCRKRSAPGDRRTRLGARPLPAFREHLAATANGVTALDGLDIGSDELEEGSVTEKLDHLIREIGVVANQSLIVAGTRGTATSCRP